MSLNKALDARLSNDGSEKRASRVTISNQASAVAVMHFIFALHG
jgi:hypothetical protein